MDKKGFPETTQPKAKYLTLALLLVWVAAVFTFTLWKFGGVVR